MQLKDDTVPAGTIETADLDKACPRCGWPKDRRAYLRIGNWWIPLPWGISKWTKTPIKIDVDGPGPIPAIDSNHYRCFNCGWNRTIVEKPDLQSVVDAASAIRK